MGSYLSGIAPLDIPRSPCPLVGLSLPQIRELHGAFKSVCDNYAIGLSEFEGIFSSNQETFLLFDTDGNGLIDALEVFSGLILYSVGSIDDKIRFLFDLYDFNETQNISLTDLEFMIQSSLISTSKLFGLGQDLSDLEIMQLIRRNFPEGMLVSLPQLLAWCSQTQEIIEFINKFKLGLLPVTPLEIAEEHKVEPRVVKEGEFNFPPLHYGETGKGFVPNPASQMVTSKRAKNFRAWLHTALQPIIAYRMESITLKNFLRSPDEVKSRLEWVYGIRCQDTKRSLQYSSGKFFATSTGTRDKYEKRMQTMNEEIVYFVSNTVVLFNTRLSLQRFYNQHANEIISMAVSNINGDFIATGEMAKLKPAIHVWNSRSLSNISVLSGVHEYGVHLLAFTFDDKFLVTCGINNPSAIIIYDWVSTNVIISTSIPSTTLDIVVLRSNTTQALSPLMAAQNKIVEGFVILSKESLVLFVFDRENNQFKLSYIYLKQAEGTTTSTPSCAISIMADYKNMYFNKGGVQKGFGRVVGGGQEDAETLDMDHSLKHIVLTGHIDGHILIWRLQSYVGALVKYPSEVTTISHCYDGIAFGTADGTIYIWDEYLLRCNKKIDINQLPFKILSSYITSLDFSQKRLLVLTMNGDAIEIVLTEQGSQKLIKANRFNTIVRLTGTQNNAMTILTQTEETMMIGGDNGIVSSFDIATHELIDIWNVGQPITALDALSPEEGEFRMAVGTDSGKVVVRLDWEEFIPRQYECGSKKISDVKFSHTGNYLAAASIDKNIYLFKYEQQAEANQIEYIQVTSCQLGNGFPVSLKFSDDNSKILICTDQRKLLILDPVSFTLAYKPEDINCKLWPQWESKYTILPKSRNSPTMPLVLGNLSNIVAAGDDHGNLHLWKEVESIKEHIGSNYCCHTSQVSTVALTSDDTRLISMGLNDSCICQFKVKQLFNNSTAPSLKRGVDQSIMKEPPQKVILHPEQDETLILELNYCFQIITRKTDDIQDQTALIRGSNNEVVNRLLAKPKFDKQIDSWKRPPQISLCVEHVYGILVADKRNTVMYIHFFNHKEEELAHLQRQAQFLTDRDLSIGQTIPERIDNLIPRFQSLEYQQQLRQARHVQYDPIHAQCMRNVIYFTSRIGVVYDMTKRKQQFYQGHKLKISAIARHPTKDLVATGEVNINPFIHIWDAKSLETVVMLVTSHKGGVLHLCFSPDGEKLISIGMDRTFSIQIFKWRQYRTLAFRNTGYNPIFGIKFNPFDDTQFFTCGYQHLAEWKLLGRHLTCKKYLTLIDTIEELPFEALTLEEQNKRMLMPEKKNSLVCLDFISNRIGHSIQSEVLFGTNLGKISAYSNGQYYILNEEAHAGSPINVIKVTNVMSFDLKQAMIITAGEDGMIKIWSNTIQIKQFINIRDHVSIPDLKNLRSYGVQSIDLYPCDRKSIESKKKIYMLAGVRSGDVVEVGVEFNQDYYTIEDIMSNLALKDEERATELQEFQKLEAPPEKYFFTYNNDISCHSSLQISHKQKKIISCLYPKDGILASVGNDETLMIWDVLHNTCIVSKNLGAQATCLDFSPDGMYLCVGLANGVFMLLDSRMQKINVGTADECFSLPTLEQVMSPKQAKSSIITVKFSNRGELGGDFLAVSYNNEYKMEDVLNQIEQEDQGNPLQEMVKPMKPQGHQHIDTVKRDPSFVLIFVNKMSDQNPGLQQFSPEPFIRLHKIQLPPKEGSALSENIQKMGITKIDFSADDNYIEMASQLIDKDNNITIDQEEDVFVVWDIIMNRMVTDFEQFKTIDWPNWSLSSSINARYVNISFNRETEEKERERFQLEQMQVTHVQRIQLLNNAVMGTTFGEIFVFRFPSMHIDEQMLSEFNYQRVAKRQMAISKGFDALTSMVLSLSVFEGKKVFVSGNNDQCILQYRVEYEDEQWELDFNDYMQDVPDPFGEIPPFSKFMAQVTELWPQRLNLPEIRRNIDFVEHADPVCRLELESVIGRRAYDRRNNVKIDCQNRIVYNASSLMVFMQDNLDPNAETFISQSYLRPEKEGPNNVSPEISCFILSPDKRVLFVGTSQVEANLIVWEISTGIQLCQIPLPSISIITQLKVAYDNKHVIMVGVTPEYIPTIILLEYPSRMILCQKFFLHSLPFKIKDVEFIPGYTRRFVTCGIQHMCFWKFNGQSLEHTVGQMTIPKSFSNVGGQVYSHTKNPLGKFGLCLVSSETKIDEFSRAGSQSKINAIDEELENIYVTFLCCDFLEDTLISSGDDGYMYIWENQRIIRRIKAHEGAILCLDANKSLGLMASGGMEGIVILWQLLIEPRSNIRSLDKLKVFNLRRDLEPQRAVMDPEYNVQSVCLGSNRVIVGMRSGTILEMQISDDGSMAKASQENEGSSKIRKWMRCCDHEVPSAVAVDMRSRRIFTMTNAGMMTVWDLLTFDIIYQKDYKRTSMNLVSFKFSNKVMLTFEHDIMVLNANLDNGYDELKEFTLKLNKIGDAKLNNNEKLLAVASTAAGEPEVSLYETDGGFFKLTTFYGFKANIKYIDFSACNYYLQCEDQAGEVQLFEIESSRVITTDTVDFDLEWLSDGLRSFSPIENVRKQYQYDNKMTQMIKMVGKPVIAIGDEIGTIRLFNYPNRGSQIYYQCYSDHLYTLTQCQFSPDQRFLVSTSSHDRCVFKWKLIMNDAKAQALLSKK